MSEFLRQLDILNPQDIYFPATIIGAGGIGRPTAETLAEMGFSDITIYDDGLVEEHNRPNQAYRAKDVGLPKVDALKDIVADFADWCLVREYHEKFEGQHPLSGIVIAAVDHMELDEDYRWGRREIWEEARRCRLTVPLFIDARIGREYLEIFTIRPSWEEDADIYESFLYSDEDAVKLECTEQGIIYVGKIAGALIARQIKYWIKKERDLYRTLKFDFQSLYIDLNYPVVYK